ncbi:MAG: sigma-70 family RNA polymerase sigma factor [Myxococcales bacterium]|nr:sigma-70 family RNA polymerase sigma factor [Myxococcales bacterium]
MDVEAELYRAWVAGDRNAGARLIERALPSVSRFFANKVVATAEHEDLVAMTFERCAKSLGGWRGAGSFRGYVLGIALNVLRDELRRRAPPVPMGSASHAARGPSPSAALAERDEQRLLLAGLRAIPIEYQTVRELQLFEDLSRDECAALLGVPAGTVASRVRRARELLAAAVEQLAGTLALAETTVSGIDAWARSVRERLV